MKVIGKWFGFLHRAVENLKKALLLFSWDWFE